ncbi:hypothetical protein ACP4OV_031889 [Aristida adscensionis]
MGLALLARAGRAPPVRRNAPLACHRVFWWRGPGLQYEGVDAEGVVSIGMSVPEDGLKPERMEEVRHGGRDVLVRG